MVKAVIFDADGTLLDSFDVIMRAYAHLATMHGYPVATREEVKAHLALARPLPDIMQSFFPDHDVNELIRINGEFISEHIVEALAYEGLETLLADLYNRDIKLAIVTGGNSKMLDILRHHNIDHYFTSVVHCERVSKAKPDPEGFLLAAQECGVLPSEAVMVGDSPNDIFAGKNGGAAITIAITHGHGSRNDLLAADPDYTVDSLDELARCLEKLTADTFTKS